MSARSATYLAPAKLNLWLEVLGRRPDGFHELDTVMLAIDLADRVTARRLEKGGMTLELEGPAASADVPADERNLAWRAAVATRARLAQAAGIDPEVGLELWIEKRVPSQSGLGGASSDAAAAMLAVEEALGARLRDSEREALLAGLGSDCNFFLAPGGLARCRGRGEEVEARVGETPGWSIVVLTPDVACSTAAVYDALRAPLRAEDFAPSLQAWPRSSTATEARGILGNGLEGAALESSPRLREWRALLDAEGLSHFRLSGSGSSFYGLFEESGEARACVQALAAACAAASMQPRLLHLARALGRGASRA